MQFWKKPSFQAGLLNIILTLGYIWYLFRTLFLTNGKFMYCLWGDADKNYYTYLYHSLYGKGITFTGMNYPFGEHVTFTDNQPLLALPIAFLRNYIHLEPDTILFIMNALIPLNFLISSFILFLLLKKLNINAFLGAVYALIITAMTPNIFRIFGHFGLSYNFFIPAIMLLMLYYFELKKIKYLLAIYLISFLMAFFHVYNLAISLILVLTICMSYFVFQKDTIKSKLKYILPIISTVFISFISLKLFFLLTDFVKDRTENPWGILYFTTKLKDIFTTCFSNLGDIYNLLFNQTEGADASEGFAYIGLLGGFTILFILINFLFFVFNKKNEASYITTPTPLNFLMSGGFLALIFSMGIPFIWNMEFLLDFIPAIKQFRGLGRFSIIFYYAISIYLVFLINKAVQYFIVEKKYQLATSFLIIMVGISTIEIFGYSKSIQPRLDMGLTNYNDYLGVSHKMQAKPSIQQIAKTHQAIIAMPFFLIGAEKVSFDSYGHIIQNAFQLSLATKLPMLNTHLSRSSYYQSMALVRFISGAFTNKKVITDLLNDKPILLTIQKMAVVSDGEQYLVNNATFIDSFESWNYYSLDWKKLIAKEQRLKDSILQQTIQTSERTIVNHFDETSNTKHLFGKSALNVAQQDSLILYNNTTPFATNEKVEFSVWSYIDYNKNQRLQCQLFFLDSAKKEVERIYIQMQINTNDNVERWVRNYQVFDWKPNFKYLKIVYYNINKQCASDIDEMQIRPITENSIYKTNNQCLFNNHIIEK